MGLLAVYSLLMDAIDRTIIAILRNDGRISVTDLSDQISLSLSATSERLRRLQRDGVIAGFTVVVDAKAAGRPIEALVDGRMGHGSYAGALESLVNLECIIDAVHVTGRFDTQLRVAARDVAELDDLLETLKDTLGAEETNTRLVLRTIDGFPRPVQLAP